MRLACLPALLLAASGALAQPVQIAGPAGPLEAEMIAVADAAHAVVLIPGSGPTDRDGNAPQMGLRSDMYRQLAEALAAEGVASLRIDKRGFFGSAAAIADPNDVTIAAYAQDARDWVTHAAGLAPCVWIAGHSEGGLVALVAAQDPPAALCGLILLAAPGRPVGQLLLEQMRAMPGTAPLMPEIEATVAAFEGGRRIALDDLPPALRPMFPPEVQGFMSDLFSYDPSEVAADWRGPVLIVQGDADIQIRPLDADLLAAALPQATRADLPDATHMLKPDLPGQPLATYTDPDLPLHPGLVPTIMALLRAAPVD